MSSMMSTNAMSSALTNSILNMQAQLARAQKEMSTGNVSDLGDSLGSNVGLDYSYGATNSMLTAIQSTNNLVSSRLDITQSALSNIASDASNLRDLLLQAQSNNGSVSTMETEAQNSLENLTSTLNTSDGGGFVFGGINSATAPMSSYVSTPTSAAQQSVATAFSTAFGMSQTSGNVSSISAQQMQTFLTGAFANLFSSGNWSANWSQASSQPTQNQISLFQTVNTSVTANDPALRQLAEGYTMLSDLNLSKLSQSTASTIIAAASSLINQGISGLTQMQANVGIMQSDVSNANQMMSIQQNFFQTQIGSMENVDQTQTATQVNSLTTQIETAYQLTAKLQQLSLAQYL